jgi:hypothetical protein
VVARGTPTPVEICFTWNMRDTAQEEQGSSKFGASGRDDQNRGFFAGVPLRRGNLSGQSSACRMT